ncbi:hypothetical protein ABZP36_014921, partial [Zizania latifolia]
GGLIGLLRGIEKFDASRDFRISTYVYWWIRQGVSRALAENSKTFRLPTYLHERLIAIRGAKVTQHIEKESIQCYNGCEQDFFVGSIGISLLKRLTWRDYI